MPNRSVPEISDDILTRAVDTRIALEAARRRARMYLADPANDRAPHAEVALMEVLGLLETAPEAAHYTSRHHRAAEVNA